MARHKIVIEEIIIESRWLTNEFPDLKQYLDDSIDYCTLYSELYHWTDNDAAKEFLMKFILDKYLSIR